MAYQMKNSPINKGTAAKPSPMKEPVTGIAALIAGAKAALATKVGTAIATGVASTVAGKGIGTIGKGKARRKEEKLHKEQQAREASANLAENIGSKQIGTGSRIV